MYPVRFFVAFSSYLRVALPGQGQGRYFGLCFILLLIFIIIFKIKIPMQCIFCKVLYFPSRTHSHLQWKEIHLCKLNQGRFKVLVLIFYWICWSCSYNCRYIYLELELLVNKHPESMMHLYKNMYVWKFESLLCKLQDENIHKNTNMESTHQHDNQCRKLIFNAS